MKIRRVAAIAGGLAWGAVAGVAFQFTSASAAVPAGGHVSVAQSSPVASPTASPSASPSCPPMRLAIAFTNSVTDVASLHLHLPWGRPGDPEGRMIEDYGAFDGVSVREQLPVHDVTSGTLRELSGHNAIDIVLDSGTPLYAVTSGTIYKLTNWTIPGGPQGYAVVVVSDVLTDDQGDAIAFLYGHVREFDVESGRHVAAGALIAKSGGDPDDAGAGFRGIANAHLRGGRAAAPPPGHAGTVQ